MTKWLVVLCSVFFLSVPQANAWLCEGRCESVHKTLPECTEWRAENEIVLDRDQGCDSAFEEKLSVHRRTVLIEGLRYSCKVEYYCEWNPGN